MTYMRFCDNKNMYVKEGVYTPVEDDLPGDDRIVACIGKKYSFNCVNLHLAKFDPRKGWSTEASNELTVYAWRNLSEQEKTVIKSNA